MKTKTIRQTATFTASAVDVYDALMNAMKHVAFTGADASIEKKVNGKFNMYGRYCDGHHPEWVKNQKMIQTWHFAKDGWPDDRFSTCTPVLNQTQLAFTQTDVPGAQSTRACAGSERLLPEGLERVFG